MKRSKKSLIERIRKPMAPGIRVIPDKSKYNRKRDKGDLRE